MTAPRDFEALKVENAKLRDEIDHVRSQLLDCAGHNARLRSDEPGTPLGRLKAVGDYAVKVGLCSGIEAKPAELFLIESYARLRAALEEIVNPLTAMQKRAEVEGTRLSGMAYSIAHSVSYLQQIAREAIAEEEEE